ncbi:MAG: S1C family serine protease, partial [Rhodovarius sp.]|nr:S1C family serine protease [Rhodovarius sp.]
MSEKRFFFRTFLLVLAGLVLMTAWQSIPLIQAQILAGRAEPRPITPRGDLAADEQATIALFERARGSVVYIATTERLINPWTRNALQVPRGTGSGFIWDELGHVVTNDHVVAGASGAIVRLADGRAFQAVLV